MLASNRASLVMLVYCTCKWLCSIARRHAWKDVLGHKSQLTKRPAVHPQQALVPSISAFEGAVLIADISGFTALTEQLSRAEFGVELLTKCINDFFARVSATAGVSNAHLVPQGYCKCVLHHDTQWPY